MKVLLDNNLSQRLIPLLNPAGWDVVHVRDLGMASAQDEEVMEAARSAGRVLISADSDFGALLAASHASAPSVVLIRRVSDRRVEALAGILLNNLPGVTDDLVAGAVIVVGDDSLRVRRLPIG